MPLTKQDEMMRAVAEAVLETENLKETLRGEILDTLSGLEMADEGRADAPSSMKIAIARLKQTFSLLE